MVGGYQLGGPHYVFLGGYRGKVPKDGVKFPQWQTSLDVHPEPEPRQRLFARTPLLGSTQPGLYIDSSLVPRVRIPREHQGSATDLSKKAWEVTLATFHSLEESCIYFDHRTCNFTSFKALIWLWYKEDAGLTGWIYWMTRLIYPRHIWMHANMHTSLGSPKLGWIPHWTVLTMCILRHNKPMQALVHLAHCFVINKMRLAHIAKAHYNCPHSRILRKLFSGKLLHLGGHKSIFLNFSLNTCYASEIILDDRIERMIEEKRVPGLKSSNCREKKMYSKQ